jgi:hypothetical protein
MVESTKRIPPHNQSPVSSPPIVETVCDEVAGPGAKNPVVFHPEMDNSTSPAPNTMCRDRTGENFIHPAQPHSAPTNRPAVSFSPIVGKIPDRADGTGAETPVVTRTEMDKPTSPARQTTKTHDLYEYSFEFNAAACVKDAANGAQFLFEIARALTELDKDSSILSNSTSEKPPIDGNTLYPTDPLLLETFVCEHIEGLRLTAKSALKGKITVRTHYTFKKLHTSKAFRNFCQGKWNGATPTPVSLELHTLPCAVRHQVGFFLNTMAGNDMETYLTEMIARWFSESRGFPLFQVVPFTMFRGKTKAVLYGIWAAKGCVSTLEKAFTNLFPTPSAKLSFVLSTTWGKLKSKQQTDYLEAHDRFQKNHSYHLLDGVLDSSVEISVSPNPSQTKQKQISVLNYIKNKDVFELVEPPFSSGTMLLVATRANTFKAQQFIASISQQIIRRATALSVDQIFLDPAAVRAKVLSANAVTKPAATVRASKATGTPASQNLSSYLQYDPSTQEIPTPEKSKRISKKKGPPSDSYGGAKGKEIIFHISAPTTPGECASSGASPHGTPSASDGDLHTSPKSKRRQRKKKKHQGSVDPVSASTSPTPTVSNPVAPRTAVSAVSEEAMDIGEAVDASPTSVESTRSYASVTGTQFSPTEANGTTETPSSVTESAVLSNLQSQIADLKCAAAKSEAQVQAQAAKSLAKAQAAKSKAQAQKVKSQAQLAQLEAQVLSISRAHTGARSIAETTISEPSSVTAPTPEVDLDESNAEPIVSAPSSDTVSPVDAEVDGAAATFPQRERYSTQTMKIPRPSDDDSDSPPSSKIVRYSELIDTQQATATDSNEEVDAEIMVNHAASQVSHLTLETPIPRSPSSESGMPL